MPELFGHTRARIGPRHALITPENHVPSALPGLTGASAIILIDAGLGARFSQWLVTFEKGGAVEMGASETESFGYVMTGAITFVSGRKNDRLECGHFFFAPAGHAFSLNTPRPGTQLTLFRKTYLPLEGVPAPRSLVGAATAITGQPFLGDPAATLRVLLPEAPAFDLAVNLFSYQPGGHLPFVEVHSMEHGLIILEGEGVYRLEDEWYPVRAGDVIWMAPFCPQWFVAMGSTPATYLYYKDVNRFAR
jgi:(S)-ureidoglycine aminohydrolase